MILQFTKDCLYVLVSVVFFNLNEESFVLRVFQEADVISFHLEQRTCFSEMSTLNKVLMWAVCGYILPYKGIISSGDKGTCQENVF